MANATGSFNGFGSPAINNAGMVTFEASFDRGGEALLLMGKTLQWSTLHSRDTFFGLTITTGWGMGLDGLNDAGQIAFFATIGGGSYILIHAGPLPTPTHEPSTLLPF